jgi:hypothetical protein
MRHKEYDVLLYIGLTSEVRLKVCNMVYYMERVMSLGKHHHTKWINAESQN